MVRHPAQTQPAYSPLECQPEDLGIQPMKNILDQNIDTLELAVDFVREEFDFDTIKWFYHLVLLECADRMHPKDFDQSVKVAQEQLRRPQ